MTSLVVGDLNFKLRRSDRRRTMQITVERDGSLTMTAPQKCRRDQLERFARAKRQWVYEKLALKELLPPPASKAFVSGEGCMYLGRHYRLRLVAQQGAPVLLESGRFGLRTALAHEGRQHFRNWYTEHARPWLQARVAGWAERLGVSTGAVIVRDHAFRWASCGAAGHLYFHWKVIQLPPKLIDYVIVHELVHLKHPDHGRVFWAAVARVMPDYETRKQQLFKFGVDVW